QSNHMNTSLLTLYRKGNPDSLPSSPKNDLMMSTTTSQTVPRSDTVSPQAPSVTKISEGGWFIDKTPGPKEENFFIDLCAEEECDNIKQKAKNAGNNSILETTRKKSKDKKYKRRKVEFSNVDEEIESVLKQQK
ncbi:nuclear valosin-containing protein-like, partial [Notechis scutatus]|uniref:Nuclear valosin-containing protein-like n=1 Tax=Notechis scutatus TaxID=8663 RepID=A0A6J1W3W6_9SAUR